MRNDWRLYADDTISAAVRGAAWRVFPASLVAGVKQHGTAQITFCFDANPMPEARENQRGVLTGPGLIREWWPDRNERAAAWLVVRRRGGDYCYAVSSQIGSCWSGFAPSLKWNRFPCLEECIAFGTDEIGRAIKKAAASNDSDVPKKAVMKLLAAFDRGEFVQKEASEDS